jgi:tRNA (cmo5U34)-methyltransferase
MKKKKLFLSVGGKLNVSKNWKFTKNVSREFDRHVNQSIPEYLEMQNYIASLSQFFIKDDQIIYDLGCSTGQTAKNILDFVSEDIKYQIIGVDSQKEMINLAIKKFDKKILNKKIKFLHNDILKMKLKKNNLIISCLLMNFLSKSNQDKLLRKIYKSLNIGGALILVDKVFSANAQHQTIFDQLYNDFKLKKKLSSKAIINKQISLRSSMTLSKSEDVISDLRKVGFKKVDIFYKWFNFLGTVSIK